MVRRRRTRGAAARRGARRGRRRRGAAAAGAGRPLPRPQGQGDAVMDASMSSTGGAGTFAIYAEVRAAADPADGHARWVGRPRRAVRQPSGLAAGARRGAPASRAAGPGVRPGLAVRGRRGSGRARGGGRSRPAQTGPWCSSGSAWPISARPARWTVWRPRRTAAACSCRSRTPARDGRAAARRRPLPAGHGQGRRPRRGGRAAGAGPQLRLRAVVCARPPVGLPAGARREPGARGRAGGRAGPAVAMIAAAPRSGSLSGRLRDGLSRVRLVQRLSCRAQSGASATSRAPNPPSAKREGSRRHADRVA